MADVPGLLEATWNPSWGAAHIVVDAGMWSTSPAVVSIRVERTSASEGTVPVRGLENLVAPGGGYVGTDHELPINEQVTYQVFGFDAFGDQVPDTGTAVITPTVGQRTMYLKIAGRPDLTQTPILQSVGDTGSETRGEVYEVIGGPAVPQDAGGRAYRAQITLKTTGEGAARALETLLAAPLGRTLLIQQGGAAELTPGWWWCRNWYRTDPAQKDFTVYPYRHFVLELVATVAPAGVGVQFTGTTWGALVASQATWQDVQDTYPTWLDVLLGT